MLKGNPKEGEEKGKVYRYGIHPETEVEVDTPKHPVPYRLQGSIYHKLEGVA